MTEIYIISVILVWIIIAIDYWKNYYQKGNDIYLSDILVCLCYSLVPWLNTFVMLFCLFTALKSKLEDIVVFRGKDTNEDAK